MLNVIERKCFLFFGIIAVKDACYRTGYGEKYSEGPGGSRIAEEAGAGRHDPQTPHNEFADPVIEVRRKISRDAFNVLCDCLEIILLECAQCACEITKLAVQGVNRIHLIALSHDRVYNGGPVTRAPGSGVRRPGARNLRRRTDARK